MFRKPITTPKKQSPQQAPQQQAPHLPDRRTKQQRAQQETSELLARKTFLLLLFTLDQDQGADNQSSFVRLQRLSEEVHEYLRIYMA